MASRILTDSSVTLLCNDLYGLWNTCTSGEILYRLVSVQVALNVCAYREDIPS